MKTDLRPLSRITPYERIRPHRGNWELFVDENNHCSLCAHHHGVKTAQGP